MLKLIKNQLLFISLFVIAIANSVSAVYYTDGIYHPTYSDCHIAAPQQIIDNNAKKDDGGSIFSDISTNYNVDVNTQQGESKEINNVNVALNFSASKGPVYVQYSHARSYYRNVDDITTQAYTGFQGVVNNRVVVGVCFAPQTSNSPAVSQQTNDSKQTTTAAANPDNTASGLRVSSVN